MELYLRRKSFMVSVSNSIRDPLPFEDFVNPPGDSCVLVHTQIDTHTLRYTNHRVEESFLSE